MRELTLLQTVYLAGLLSLSLVLPLLMSFRGPQDAAIKKSCMKTVWIGQTLSAFAAVVVLASAPFAPFAAAFGLVSMLRSFCYRRSGLSASSATLLAFVRMASRTSQSIFGGWVRHSTSIESSAMAVFTTRYLAFLTVIRHASPFRPPLPPTSTITVGSSWIGVPIPATVAQAGSRSGPETPTHH